MHQRILIYAATAALTCGLAYRLYTRGGPYFAAPATVVDHVGPTEHETRRAILLFEKVAKLIPRDATVTAFRPRYGDEHYDTDVFLTAVGMLPYQKVYPSFAAGRYTPKDQLVEWVIAVDQEFTHPHYHVVAQHPEGRLYRRNW